MLIGDYSTLSTDFSILRRPQLFVMPDYDKVRQTKGFAEDMRAIIPGKKVDSADDLYNSIRSYIGNNLDYENDFGVSIDNILGKYIDITKPNSRERYAALISEILEK